MYQLQSTYFVIYLSQLSYKFIIVLFETLSLFILRETRPEILGLWEELEFTAMSTILLIVFKFSTSSTTNYFPVFPKELKDRSGSSPCACACASIQIER